MEPTPRNLQKASNLAFEIRRKIKLHQFVMGDYFPELEPQQDVPDFESIARQYLASINTLSERTQSDYRKSLNCHWMPYLAGKQIDLIKYGELLLILNELDFQSAKTRNNSLIPLRGVFAVAVADQWIKDNPAALLKSQKVQAPEPDPFDVSEVFKIIDGFKIAQWQNYFRYQFFSGQRPSETIALQWSDIDFNSGFVRVDKVRSMGKIRQHTKNYKRRNVPINSQMLMALKKQKQHTFIEGGYVFLNPNTGKPIVNDKPPRVAWNPVLKKSGIRHRTPYQCRSTSITMQIMAGENLYKIAKDHGHNLETMLKHYAGWIDKVEVKESKIDQFLQEQKK